MLWLFGGKNERKYTSWLAKKYPASNRVPLPS